MIVTKDSDIVELSIIRGAPPKIVWLRVRNASTDRIAELLRTSEPAIGELVNDPSRTVLELLA